MYYIYCPEYNYTRLIDASLDGCMSLHRSAAVSHGQGRTDLQHHHEQ